MSTLIPTTYDQSSQPQQSFASHYDLDNPEEAVSSYSKRIHQHTLRQMELAAISSAHRPNGNSAVGSMNSEGSADSVGSVQQ